MVIGDILGVDTDRYRLPNGTCDIDDCVLRGKPVGNEVPGEGGLNIAREVVGKAHGQCPFPET
jgi:hypothetical protein